MDHGIKKPSHMVLTLLRIVAEFPPAPLASAPTLQKGAVDPAMWLSQNHPAPFPGGDPPSPDPPTFIIAYAPNSSCMIDSRALRQSSG